MNISETKLRKIIRHEANCDIGKYMSHLIFSSYECNFRQRNPNFSTLIQDRYDTANRNANEILNNIRLSTPVSYDTSYSRERFSAQYLKDYHTKYYTDMITSIQSKLAIVDKLRGEFNHFFAAFR